METSDRSKRVPAKPKYLSESALYDASSALDSISDIEKSKPITALMVVEKHIHKIIELREKGVPSRRIFQELKKSTKMRISFDTFISYIAKTSVDAGIREKRPEWVRRGLRCPSCLKANPIRIADGIADGIKYECAQCGSEYRSADGKMTSKPYVSTANPDESFP